jgi:hypothetical protein
VSEGAPAGMDVRSLLALFRIVSDATADTLQAAFDEGAYAPVSEESLSAAYVEVRDAAVRALSRARAITDGVDAAHDRHLAGGAVVNERDRVAAALHRRPDEVPIVLA